MVVCLLLTMRGIAQDAISNHGIRNVALIGTMNCRYNKHILPINNVVNYTRFNINTKEKIISGNRYKWDSIRGPLKENNQGMANSKRSFNEYVPQPPIPVEVFAGHKALSYQHVINKNVFKDKFSFFNVSSFDAEYGENANNVFLISSMFLYNISKGFSAGLGGEIQRPGAVVIAGIQYTYVSENLLIVVVPSVNLTGETEYSQFTLLEYRPRINKKFNGYFRMQFVVSTDFHNYNRGYQQFRLGSQINDIRFGLAASFDQFDSNAITTTNYGVFVRTLIF